MTLRVKLPISLVVLTAAMLMVVAVMVSAGIAGILVADTIRSYASGGTHYATSHLSAVAALRTALAIALLPSPTFPTRSRSWRPTQPAHGLSFGAPTEIETRLAPDVDICGAAELDGLLTGLDGRFVAPGPSGAPTPFRSSKRCSAPRRFSPGRLPREAVLFVWLFCWV